MTEQPNSQTHLTPDEVEAAAESSASLPAPRRAHTSACARCARDVEELRHLSTALAALPSPGPPSGFADRVMARVSLPVPLHVRLAAAVRQRTAAGIAAAASIAALLAGAGVWVSYVPELSPMTLAGWLAAHAGDLAWQGAIALGRTLYATGIVDLAGAVRAEATLASAVAALVTIVLVSFGSLSVLVRLVRHDRRDPRELARAR